MTEEQLQKAAALSAKIKHMEQTMPDFHKIKKEVQLIGLMDKNGDPIYIIEAHNDEKLLSIIIKAVEDIISKEVEELNSLKKEFVEL